MLYDFPIYFFSHRPLEKERRVNSTPVLFKGYSYLCFLFCFVFSLSLRPIFYGHWRHEASIIH